MKDPQYIIHVYKRTELESGVKNDELVYLQVFPEDFDLCRLITDLNKTEFSMATTQESMEELAIRYCGPDKTLGKPLSNDQ